MFVYDNAGKNMCKEVSTRIECGEEELLDLAVLLRHQAEDSGKWNANIESLKAQIKTFEENATWLNRLLPDKTLYGLKANLAMYEYMSENGITSSGVMSVSSGADFSISTIIILPRLV